MLMRLLTGLSILVLLSSFAPFVPSEVWTYGKWIIMITVIYRIYDYIAVQHWEWVLPFVVLLLLINPFFSFDFQSLSNGKIIETGVRIIATVFLGYSFKHLS
jgi:energy-coupling factor transporter transmembrane protein EcfT